MNISNPTRIQIGARGTFGGVMYRVAGRALMGMVEAGQTYYWNEFNLESGAGQSATLVFEGGSFGGKWRFFKLTEPSPLTAPEAVSMRVGARLRLDGMEFSVIRIDSSRVYYIEGKAPEGEHVGSEANYFNSQAGAEWAVVSWTGDEVECYRGRTISAREVASAFHLQGIEAFRFILGSGRSSVWPAFSRLALPIFAIALVLLLFASGSRTARPPAVIKIIAPVPTLSVGRVGVLNGTNYHIVGHALVDAAEVGLLAQRHEYCLQDDRENAALLIPSGNPEPAFYNEIHPDTSLTPQQAAGLRAGEAVKVGDVAAIVRRLCRFTVRQTDGLVESKPGDVFYGFTAGTNSISVLVRWNKDQIKFYQGGALPSKIQWDSAK